MRAAVKLREDYSAEELRLLAKRSKDANQSRRLLSLAAVLDGMDRGEAAKIGGMDRQTLRDRAHRFNEKGPDGLFDNWTDGPKRRLSRSQLHELAGSSKAARTRKPTAWFGGGASTCAARSRPASASTITNAMSESF